MAEVPDKAKPFVACVCAVGMACLLLGMLPWHSSDTLEFVCYVALTAIASALKVVLPGFEGTVSVNFVFVLVGIGSMTLSETLVFGIAAAIVQCYWKATRRLHVIHFIFNLSQVAIAITAAYWLYRFASVLLHGRTAIGLLLAAIVYFLLNTLPVATVVALAEKKPIIKKWRESYSWPFPYYLIGAAIAGVIQLVNHIAGWEMSLLLLPALYAIYRSYRLYLGRWEDEKRHLQDIASLHMRTIETLALAIEAKDHTTGDHLQRVRVYALELAKDLGLTEDETEALKAASVLHDIGKLAVPEHIISKPGKLTPEEFDKMKVHPIVGAEILQQVRFPYPVSPIVRSHHEKWDGSGYPDGLSGENIPIGARILAAVDCLDALASDRQYRRALPLDEAMSRVDQEAGKSFDPRVVAGLKARYRELEKLAKSQEPEERQKLSTDVKVKRGAAPAAGFAVTQSQSAPSGSATRAVPVRSLSSVSEAGSTSNLQEILSTVAVRLRHSIPYDALAVFVIDGDTLLPRFVLGENFRQLSSLRIKVGQGLAGWVAETGKCIVNGNPSVEPGYTEQPNSTPLRAAIAVPLRGAGDTLAVLVLYHTQAEAFSSDHLRSLEVQSPELGKTIEKCLDRQQGSAETPLLALAASASSQG
jgi:putative nucleotidyltransferase with HDIG domain